MAQRERTTTASALSEVANGPGGHFWTEFLHEGPTVPINQELMTNR